MTTVWGITDDRTGHTGQVFGVISRLGLPYVIKRLEYNQLQLVPSLLLGASLSAVTAERRELLVPPYPKLVIAAGRRTLPVLRYIKRQSPSTRTVYLMRAEVNEDIDLMVVPEHDHVTPRPNIITTLAPLHAVTPQGLTIAKREWLERFSHLPRPWIALCLGGNTKRGGYSDVEWRELVQRAMLLAGQGSLLVTTSRRTPVEALNLIDTLLKVPHLYHRWDRDKENPYLAMLGAADGIIVTGDSLSMCAEACSTGKPVFIYSSTHVAPTKHRELHAALITRGLAHPLTNTSKLDVESATAPLDEVGSVAEEILKRFPEVAAYYTLSE